MTAAVLRQELQGYIATMPERNLYALKPLLTVLAEPLYTIESATTEEIAMIDERMKDYETKPSSWVPLENIR
jgi:hypothetical protein